MTTLPVTGSQITRILYRTGHGGAATGARATVDALRQAAREYAEAATAGGRTKGGIVIRPLRDPTDPAPATAVRVARAR
ncbi:hypothetical protein [Streptomyces sp. NPDC056160]|uniref:hypothetical protein n=1 Tax=Streptomyces sp. NPDC056160 TaxID=3345731 RepID=UPI0035E33B51